MTTLVFPAWERFKIKAPPHSHKLRAKPYSERKNFPELAQRKNNCIGDPWDPPALGSLCCSCRAQSSVSPEQRPPGLRLLAAQPCGACCCSWENPSASGAIKRQETSAKFISICFVFLPVKTNHCLTCKHCSTWAGKTALYAPVYSFQEWCDINTAGTLMYQQT